MDSINTHVFKKVAAYKLCKIVKGCAKCNGKLNLPWRRLRKCFNCSEYYHKTCASGEHAECGATRSTCAVTTQMNERTESGHFGTEIVLSYRLTLFYVARPAQPFSGEILVERLTLHIRTNFRFIAVRITCFETEDWELVPYSMANEAKVRFQNVYNSVLHEKMSIKEGADMFLYINIRLKKGKEMFPHILKYFYDELNLLSEYDETKIVIAGNLFGATVGHALLNDKDYIFAQRFGLRALMKNPNTVMFKFGIAYLDGFKSMLRGQQRYCDRLLKIPHINQFPPHLIEILNANKTQPYVKAKPNIYYYS